MTSDVRWKSVKVVETNSINSLDSQGECITASTLKRSEDRTDTTF